MFDLGAAGGGLFGKRLHPGFHLRQFAAQTTDFALFGGQLGIEAANHLFESLDAQVGFAQLRRGALQRSDLLPVLLQQPVDRGDVGIDLLDRTAHPFVIARERDEVFARTDPRQILGDGIDVGEDDLDERILRCTTVCSATRRLTHDTNAHAAQSIGRQMCFIISDGLIVITASKISRKAAGCTKKTHRRRPPA